MLEMAFARPYNSKFSRGSMPPDPSTTLAAMPLVDEPPPPPPKKFLDWTNSPNIPPANLLSPLLPLGQNRTFLLTQQAVKGHIVQNQSFIY